MSSLPEVIGHKLITGKTLTARERTWLARLILRSTELVTTDSISERTAKTRLVREMLSQVEA